MLKKINNQSGQRIIQKDNSSGKFHLTAKKQTYIKVKLYSQLSGYTMSSIVETAIEEFFSKSEWEEITSDYILSKLDYDD